MLPLVLLAVNYSPPKPHVQAVMYGLQERIRTSRASFVLSIYCALFLRVGDKFFFAPIPYFPALTCATICGNHANTFNVKQHTESEEKSVFKCRTF